MRNILPDFPEGGAQHRDYKMESGARHALRAAGLFRWWVAHLHRRLATADSLRNQRFVHAPAPVQATRRFVSSGPGRT